MNINPSDMIEKYDYIDVIKVENGYRIHNSVCGLILKVDKITALVILLINNSNTYEELKLKIEKCLGKSYIYEDDIKNILINLYNL